MTEKEIRERVKVLEAELRVLKGQLSKKEHSMRHPRGKTNEELTQCGVSSSFAVRVYKFPCCNLFMKISD